MHLISRLIFQSFAKKSTFRVSSCGAPFGVKMIMFGIFVGNFKERIFLLQYSSYYSTNLEKSDGGTFTTVVEYAHGLKAVGFMWVIQ